MLLSVDRRKMEREGLKIFFLFDKKEDWEKKEKKKEEKKKRIKYIFLFYSYHPSHELFVISLKVS